jgi:hypothetical protein
MPKRTHSRTDKPKTTRKQVTSTPTPIPGDRAVVNRANAIAAATRAKYTNMQIEILQRNLAPVPIKVPIPATKADLVKMQVELVQMNYDRKITETDYSLGNQAVQVLRNCSRPPR